MTVLRLAFVGQCHILGYPGVPADRAFPEVCRGVLQAHRPAHRVSLLLEPYYHPFELEQAVRRALRQKPRAVIVEVPGWLAVSGKPVVDLSRLPSAVRTTYQRVRHFHGMAARVVARTSGAVPQLIYRAETSALALAGGALRPLMPRHRRATLLEYEECVSRALAAMAQAPGVQAVVQGPGAPNLALDAPSLPADLVARYHAVREMAPRVAQAHGALFVDRWDTVSRGFFSEGSVRPSAQGHSAFGHLLASELLAHGVV
ncbi:MAG TPA: SGNH/GDSL hydrolase family protein [Thermoanaerobaculia bacterium]